MSSLTAAQYIRHMQPRLYTDSEARDFYVALAEEHTSASYFKNQYNYAVALRAMHNYIIDQERPDGEAGLVTGKSEGNASIRYYNKVEKGIYSDLQMTHYGQRLKALMKAKGPALSVAADSNNVLSRIVSSMNGTG